MLGLHLVLVALHGWFTTNITRILSIFEFKHELWTIPTTNMTCTRSQNNTNMVVGKHGLQIVEILVVVLLFLWLLSDVLVPTSAHLLLFLDK